LVGEYWNPFLTVQTFSPTSRDALDFESLVYGPRKKFNIYIRTIINKGLIGESNKGLSECEGTFENDLRMF